MRRRMVLVGVLAMALAACGGSSGSPSPSASDAGSSAAASGSPSTLPASPTASEVASPSAAPPAAGTSTAVCDGISLRKSPSSTAAKVRAINSGTSVHVVATVSGTAYTAGACGTSGSEWLKIDKVGGKTAKSLYGVTYVYAAAGFFQ
ncbi:MAG: SH3 domain-containing protein [Candidatus Limnocylindrales bacterium]